MLNASELLPIVDNLIEVHSVDSGDHKEKNDTVFLEIQVSLNPLNSKLMIVLCYINGK